MDKLFKYCHTLPKIELHSHIGGSVRAKTFLHLVMERGINIEHIDFYNINLKTAFEIFKISSELINNCKILSRVTKEIIEDYSKQNCRYLELRSTPKAFLNDTKEQYIKTIIDTIREAEAEIPLIKVRYIVSVNRNASSEAAAEVVDLMIKLKEECEAKK